MLEFFPSMEGFFYFDGKGGETRHILHIFMHIQILYDNHVGTQDFLLFLKIRKKYLKLWFDFVDVGQTNLSLVYPLMLLYFQFSNFIYFQNKLIINGFLHCFTGH